jgi:acyl-CoA dehydrogenase
MSGLSLFLVSLILLGSIAYYRMALWAGVVLLLASLLLLHQIHAIGWSAWGLAILVLATAALLAVPPLRTSWFSKPLFDWFRKILPPMSQTEREAIEAGNVGWEKSLFQGDPHWEELNASNLPPLSPAEQHFLDNQVETLCSMLNDWEIVHERADLSKAAWDYIKREKFFGIIIPKSYGGLEFSVRAHSEIITKIATRSVSAAVTVMVPNSLGPAELLLNYGTEEQKNNTLPKLATGEVIPCFALTSTEAGSDAGSMLDKGIVCHGTHNGKETLGIRLTFEKRYITLAPVATLVGVAFKLFDPDKLLGDKADVGITLALIPADHPGLEIGQRHFPLNMAFMNGPIRANNMFIPLEWIIGGEKMAGQGWRMLMECLSVGRGISLPALSTATGLLSTRMTSAYASIRKQFKLPIATFEGVEEALARIVANTYQLQAARLFTVYSIEHYIRPSIATAIAKYHMTELSRQVINDTMDIHAGRGIMLGPKNYIARCYQSMPISITVEGANILTRNLMIFGQGAIRCHPYAKEEMNAAKLYETNPVEALKEFDALLFKHIAYFTSNAVRCFVFSITRGWAVKLHSNDPTDSRDITRHYLKKLSWLSSALALTSDLALMILGGNLKRRERLSARLGDILSQLYLASAVVKYFHDSGKPSDDEPVVHWVLQNACYRAQEAFYGFFDNAPSPLLGSLLKVFIFPFGKAFTPPSDKLSHSVVKTILESSAFREGLTDLCYLGKGEDDPVNQMEITFKKLHEIKTAAEAEQLEAYEWLRQCAIAVDAFSPDYPLGVRQNDK